MRIQVKELIYGAILAALAILIPVAFQRWLQVNIPPFSATIGSHIPSFLAMFISPWAAAFVGIGSTLGFLMTLGPVVAARAAVHILFGVVGAILFRKGFKRSHILLMILPIHALEAFVVLPFGFNLYTAFVVV